MRRLFRLTHTVLSGLLASIPSRVAVEVAISGAFVVLLLAVAIHADHRGAHASPAHLVPDRLNTGGDARLPACQPDLSGKRHRPMATRSIRARAVRCGDLQSYV